MPGCPRVVKVDAVQPMIRTFFQRPRYNTRYKPYRVLEVVNSESKVKKWPVQVTRFGQFKVYTLLVFSIDFSWQAMMIEVFSNWALLKCWHSSKKHQMKILQFQNASQLVYIVKWIFNDSKKVQLEVLMTKTENFLVDFYSSKL